MGRQKTKVRQKTNGETKDQEETNDTMFRLDLVDICGEVENSSLLKTMCYYNPGFDLQHGQIWWFQTNSVCDIACFLKLDDP